MFDGMYVHVCIVPKAYTLVPERITADINFAAKVQ